jgi:predicted AAA+ superfamily ATPase
MLNVSDLRVFTLFLKLLAANASQVVNLTSISKEIGITVATLSKWLSVLEASYIIFLLPPYYKNLGKRLIKTPKLYFIDTGLLAFLTGTFNKNQWEKGVMYGPIFENFIISEILKRKYHKGLNFDMYFLRTSHGDEIDLILDHGQTTKLIEIKASETYKPVFHKTLEKFDIGNSEKSVIYQGVSKNVLKDLKSWNYIDYLNKADF